MNDEKFNATSACRKICRPVYERQLRAWSVKNIRAHQNLRKKTIVRSVCGDLVDFVTVLKTQRSRTEPNPPVPINVDFVNYRSRRKWKFTDWFGAKDMQKSRGDLLRARVASRRKIIQRQPKTRSWRFYDQAAITEHHCEHVISFYLGPDLCLAS